MQFCNLKRTVRRNEAEVTDETVARLVNVRRYHDPLIRTQQGRKLGKRDRSGTDQKLFQGSIFFVLFVIDDLISEKQRIDGYPRSLSR